MNNPYYEIEREAMNSHKTVDEILSEKKVIMCTVTPYQQVVEEVTELLQQKLKEV